MVAEEIKKAVLTAAGFENIDPAGCIRLAELIYAKTNKRVSVTTLKRVYGFASSKFNTSPYTLTVLAEYSGRYEVKRTMARKKIVTEFKPIKNLCTTSSRQY